MQVLMNRVSNAAKFTPSGEIDFGYQLRGNVIQFYVKDTGIGIPKKYQERIFERFFRVDKSRSKATGGTGLGLAIVKHITQLHDAKLEISSEEGKGTEIIVTFKD